MTLDSSRTEPPTDDEIAATPQFREWITQAAAGTRPTSPDNIEALRRRLTDDPGSP